MLDVTMKKCSMPQKTAQQHRLRALEECAASRVVAVLCKIVTPLKLERWQEVMKDFPDATMAGLIIRGIREGFRIGYDAHEATLREKGVNMLSASLNPEVVAKYLADELEADRIVQVGSATVHGSTPQSLLGHSKKRIRSGA